MVTLKLAQMGYKINIMMRPFRDEKLGEYVHHLRTRMGVRTIWSMPRRASVHETIRRLRDNEIVFILMDQNFGSSGVWVKFFGKLAATPIGPLIFAQRTRAAIVPMYIRRQALGASRIMIFPARELIRRDDPDEAVLLDAIDITAMIEGWIRLLPEQWGWIHRRWKSKPPPQAMRSKYKIQKD